MKYYPKYLLSIIYKLTSYIIFIGFGGKGNKVNISRMFFQSSYSFIGHFNTIETKGDIEKSKFSITGENNRIILNKSSIRNTTITISGKNNQIFFEDGVVLSNSTVIIRGENCKISIGNHSAFGGIRIVNVGCNNNISIGRDCMFADFIELWASDTHSIYNSAGEFINPELPVTIGDNVWIGSHVKILKGITIGNGAIIGMNTVVTKNVISRSLNVGNPIRCIKEEVTWSLKYENE
jgi:acetyltransferase-like isoleucine patch superfamily enzyme